jgi:hypothetical protein
MRDFDVLTGGLASPDSPLLFYHRFRSLLLWQTGQVRVKVEACGIWHSDVFRIHAFGRARSPSLLHGGGNLLGNISRRTLLRF